LQEDEIAPTIFNVFSFSELGITGEGQLSGTKSAARMVVINLVLRITARSNRVQSMIQALRSLMLPIQLDRGCGGCRLYADIDNPNALLYTEEWATQKDLEREIRSDRFTRLLSVMESSPTSPVLEFLIIPRTRGLEYIAEVRDSSMGPETGFES
jgi:quinol monooxygenase YgiN